MKDLKPYFKIPEDKLRHMLAGMIIYGVIFILSKNITLSFIAVILAGIGKEIYDYFNRDKHTPDINDAIYTIFGGMLIYFTFDMFYHLKDFILKG